MSTTTQLQGYTSRQWGLLLLIDGVETAFTDQAGLVGYSTGGGHDVVLGLQRDGLRIRMGIDMRESRFLDSPVEFTIVDFDGTLASLFATIDDTEQQLGDIPIGGGTRITPGEDLAARTGLHGLNVGLERIGDDGERHQYPVPPDFSIGMEHVISAPALDIEGAPVTERPIVWTGRRVALYQVFRDDVLYPDRTTGSGWRPFAEARRRWVGTMRDSGTVSGREWSIECDGPESLLRKPLFASATPKPVPCVGELSLITTGEAREDQMYVGLFTNNSYGVSNFAVSITGTTSAEVIAEVSAEIDATAAAAGVDGTWNEQAGYSASMDFLGRVRVSVDALTLEKGYLTLVLHQKVWALIGYDVYEQARLERSPDEPRYVPFVPLWNMPGYYSGDFFTGSSADNYPDGPNNGGAARQFVPLYQAGASVLRASLDGGQVVRLADAALGAGDLSTGTVSHPGQLARPIASDPSDPTSPYQLNGGDVDTAGYWLFFGKRRFAGSEEVKDEYWVGHASWVGGAAQQAGLVAADTIVVTQWLDPRLFGYPTKPPETDWAFRSSAESVEDGAVMAVPIAVLEYQQDGHRDEAAVVVQRLLMSTGTSDGWDSPSPLTPLDPGDNEPVGVHDPVLDAEIADLGLAIPSDWVADISEYSAASDRVEPSSIRQVKMAFSAGYQAEDALRSLMQPIGWCWHFRDGQFGVWCPADTLTLADATAVLDRSTMIVKHREVGSRRPIKQDIRRGQPIDRWKIQASWAPHLNKTTEDLELQAPDPQYRYRPGQVTQTVKAHAMRLRVGTAAGSGLTERVAFLSRFWARRHFEVKGYPVAPTVGEDLWPGSIVRVTDPQLVDPNGSTGYGIENRIAIVTSTNWSVGQDDSRITVDLLVLAQSSNTPRLHAPSARGIGYDVDNDRLYVAANWLDVEGDWNDASHFVEPAYTGIAPFGGDALVTWWQWDGDVWSNTGSGEVTSATSTYLQLANVTGTYYRDMDTIVVLAAPSEGQTAAWVLALYAPICADDGTWIDDVAATQTGYRWEP